LLFIISSQRNCLLRSHGASIISSKTSIYLTCQISSILVLSRNERNRHVNQHFIIEDWRYGDAWRRPHLFTGKQLPSPQLQRHYCMRRKA
jgi:hypothetical protein